MILNQYVMFIFEILHYTPIYFYFHFGAENVFRDK